MMKKVVFLLLLTISLSFQLTNAASIQVFTFPSYEIQLTRIRVDGNLGYDLEKIGELPFSKRLIYQNSDITITDIVDISNQILLYGYIHKTENNNSYYDGLLIVLDYFGNEVNKIVYDYQNEEDVKQVLYVDPIIFIHLRSSQMNEREEYDFLKDEIIAIDKEFQLLEKYSFFTEIKYITTNNQMLLIDVDNDSIFDRGITTNLEEISNDKIFLENNDFFQGEIFIPFLNSAKLNDKPVENGVYINQPGNYLLEINKQQYNFIVDPLIEGVENNQTYNKSISPQISSGSLMLGTKRFVSGDKIEKPGNYQLIINGVGGYIKIINFTITSNLKGVVNNGQYVGDVEITFNGEGYLNNGFVTSPLTIKKPGDYILQIKGEGGYVEQYTFSVTEEESTLTFASFLQDYDIIIFAITVISGYLVLKKK